MTVYVDPKNFTANALYVFKWSDQTETRDFYINAFKSYDGWVMFVDNINHPEHKENQYTKGNWQPKLIALASTRNPGDSRSFKTLDALYNEARRLADTAGASLQLTIRN